MPPAPVRAEGFPNLNETLIAAIRGRIARVIAARATVSG